MNLTLLRTMTTASLRDRISLFYATLFPLGLFAGLGYYIDTPGYAPRLMVGTIALGTLFWSMAGQSFQVLQQRNRGVYKLLRVAPLASLNFIWWMILARTVLGVAMNGLIVLAGALLFGIRVTAAGLGCGLLLLLAGSLSFTALGFFVANLAKNEAQVNMISNLLYIPMVFGSEAFYSLDKVPSWLAAAGRAFPFQYLVDGLQRTLVHGETLPAVPLLMLVLFTAAGLLLAAATFRWDEHQPVIGVKG